ncbi:hypothetical protein BLA24064_01488 [Burkholderia latens]|uniref:Uncharacterized protein n=1 Tax=Burkholderia latens TaxID=488446 RepID=A0A6P2ITU9_9BURK|nr:hypothetical protein BLA24064_01488 [Burkholderia latens]
MEFHGQTGGADWRVTSRHTARDIFIASIELC